MNLDYKPDFAEAVDTWERFWRGEAERPLLYAVRPKAGVDPVRKPRPYDLAFGEIDPIIDQALGWAETHEFMGAAVPFFMITLAPDHFGALLGGQIERSEEGKTNWVEPCLESLADVEIEFNREGRWWKRTVECAEKFRERCDGKLIVSGTHLQGSLDALVALYGTQNLLMDMGMAPDKVKAALDQVDKALLEVRAAISELFDVPQWGSVNRFGMYSPGIIDVPQCDVSCMISKEMFDEFELSYLRSEVDSTANSIYHLDGPDALQHTESICSIESLDMIQWMPGEGYYDDDWSGLNGRIDSLGKGQIFQSYYKLTAEDISRIWDTFKSRKLFFHVTPEQVEELGQT